MNKTAKDLQFLCGQLGDRRAGSVHEDAAAAYIAGEFNKAGIENSVLEKFRCNHLEQAEGKCQVKIGRAWRQAAIAPLVNSASTPKNSWVEGDVVWLEMPEDASCLSPASLRGKIALVFGTLQSDRATHRRLIKSGPAAVLHVDERLPFAWSKSDALYPAWAREIGTLPVAALPYMEAWEWRRAGVSRVRVRIKVMHRSRFSTNVVAHLPGSDLSLPWIALAAHHDTQPDNTGADDNASGVLVLLDLARQLAIGRLRRTLHFVSFGAEEQLSVGSDIYVRKHAPEIQRMGLVMNFDSVASPLGHNVLNYTGSPKLAAFVSKTLAGAGLRAQLDSELSPFSDHFPFVCAGIPTVWLWRRNTSTARWQHHGPHDNMENISLDQIRRTSDAFARLIKQCDRLDELPFERRLDQSTKRRATALRNELFPKISR